MKNEIEEFNNYAELPPGELEILEARWEKYLANPSSAISLDDFKKEIKEKCGI